LTSEGEMGAKLAIAAVEKARLVTDSDDVDGRELLMAAEDMLRVARGSKAAVDILGGVEVADGEEAMVAVVLLPKGKQKKRIIAFPDPKTVEAVEIAKTKTATKPKRRIFVERRNGGVRELEGDLGKSLAKRTEIEIAVQDGVRPAILLCTVCKIPIEPKRHSGRLPMFCKQCRKNHMKDLLVAWKAENAETVRKQKRARFMANRKDELGKRRAWRVANADKVKEQKRKAYHANPETAKTAARARYALDPEKNRQTSKKWRAANLEQSRAKQRARSAFERAKDPEAAREKLRRWCEANPERLMEIRARANAKRRAAREAAKPAAAPSGTTPTKR
jgi:hypothetical protein